MIPDKGRAEDEGNLVVQLNTGTHWYTLHTFYVLHVGHDRRGYVLRPPNPHRVDFTRLVTGQFPLLSITILEPTRDISHLFPIRKQYIG